MKSLRTWTLEALGLERTGKLGRNMNVSSLPFLLFHVHTLLMVVILVFCTEILKCPFCLFAKTINEPRTYKAGLQCHNSSVGVSISQMIYPTLRICQMQSFKLYEINYCFILSRVSFEFSLHSYKYLFRSHEINKFFLNLVTVTQSHFIHSSVVL